MDLIEKYVSKPNSEESELVITCTFAKTLPTRLPQLDGSRLL